MTKPKHAPMVLTGEKNLITERKGDYRGKVGNQGYTGPNDQVHHVLPCGASTKSKNEFLAKQKEDAALAKDMVEQTTKYNVNEKPNLIGLPTRAVYVEKFATPLGVKPHLLAATSTNAKVMACNLPVHLWSHIKYSEDAKTRTDKVWANVHLKIVKHEPVSADDIGDDIQGVSDGLRDGVTTPTWKRTPKAWREGNRVVFDIFPFP